MAIEPDALAAEVVCYLTTTGRVTAQPRSIEIWFALCGGTFYMLSGNGNRADWVKNALREPRVTIKVRESVLDARARAMNDDAEDSLARRLLLEKYSRTEERATTSLSIAEWARTSLPLAFDLVSPATTD